MDKLKKFNNYILASYVLYQLAFLLTIGIISFKPSEVVVDIPFVVATIPAIILLMTYITIKFYIWTNEKEKDAFLKTVIIINAVLFSIYTLAISVILFALSQLGYNKITITTPVILILLPSIALLVTLATLVILKKTMHKR